MTESTRSATRQGHAIARARRLANGRRLIRILGRLLEVVGWAAFLLSALRELLPVFAPPTDFSRSALVAGVVLAVLARTLRLVADHIQREAAWARRRRELTGRWPSLRVAAEDPYRLGVFRSAIANRYQSGGDMPPYVRRDIDGELESLLRTQRIVVLIGPAKWGKTRTAYEAVRRVFPDHLLIAPTSARALRTLSTEDIDQLQPTIYWLDDMERFLDSDPGTTAAFDVLTGCAPVTILATLRTAEHERLTTTTPSLGRTVRSILGGPGELRVPETLSTRETADAARLYPGERIAGSVGEHFVAGEELLARLLNSSSLFPEGAAVVQAAVDWRRVTLAGGTHDAPAALVRELFPVYYRRLRPTLPVADDLFRRGLEWAVRPISSSAALVTVDPPISRMEDVLAFAVGPEEWNMGWDSARPRLVVPDYVLERIDQRERAESHPIPDETWELALERGDWTERIHLGLTALLRGGGVDLVVRLADRAFQMPDARRAASLVWDLASLLVEEGSEAARPLLGRLISFADGEISRLDRRPFRYVPPHDVRVFGDALASRLRRYGLLSDSDAWTTALHFDRIGGGAAEELGDLLADGEDWPSAAKWYRRASMCHDDETAARAAAHLASLFQDHGRERGSRIAIGRARLHGWNPDLEIGEDDEPADETIELRRGTRLAEAGQWVEAARHLRVAADLGGELSAQAEVAWNRAVLEQYKQPTGPWLEPGPQG